MPDNTENSHTEARNDKTESERGLELSIPNDP
jgi:hypothetical protein